MLVGVLSGFWNRWFHLVPFFGGAISACMKILGEDHFAMRPSVGTWLQSAPKKKARTNQELLQALPAVLGPGLFTYNE